MQRGKSEILIKVRKKKVVKFHLFLKGAVINDLKMLWEAHITKRTKLGHREGQWERQTHCQVLETEAYINAN